MMDLLRMPEVQVVAVCDVNRQGSNYLDWGPDELRNKVRLLLQQPGWGASLAGPTAGRDVAQFIVKTFCARNSGKSGYSGCASYEDFRDLLTKEKDLDAVVVSTPERREPDARQHRYPHPGVVGVGYDRFSLNPRL
jgi:hypothetical protein